MKKLIIDMDDVITKTDYFSELEKYTNKKLDRSYKGFYLEELLGDDKANFFNNFDKVNFYKNAVLLDDCVSVLKSLNEKYDLYICSTYTWSGALDKSSTHLKNKYDYLYHNLPFIDPNKYIFTSNKNIIKADIRIDDRIENLKDGDIKLLFSAWHNLDLTDEYLKKLGIMLVNNWKEIKSILL